MGNEWSWFLDSSSMDDALWGAGEPRAENTCAEYNTELHVLISFPCDTPRGYMCSYDWL